LINFSMKNATKANSDYQVQGTDRQEYW
jgi:hypothetical protein